MIGRTTAIYVRLFFTVIPMTSKFIVARFRLLKAQRSAQSTAIVMRTTTAHLDSYFSNYNY
jgi:hypothetical protein